MVLQAQGTFVDQQPLRKDHEQQKRRRELIMDEEKAMEIEALEAIYMEDFRMVAEDKFEIILTPTENEESKVSVSLDVKLPPKYPEEVPSISLRALKGTTNQKLFDLEKKLREQAKENLGAAMIFTLAQTVKEWLDNMVSLSKEEVIPVETAEEKLQKEKEAMELRLQGTPISIEVFTAWKTKFDAEMKELKKTSVDLEKLRRPTGRQLFEIDISLVMSDTNIPEEGDTVDVSALAKENVVVNWELFDAIDVPDDE